MIDDDKLTVFVQYCVSPERKHEKLRKHFIFIFNYNLFLDSTTILIRPKPLLQLNKSSKLNNNSSKYFKNLQDSNKRSRSKQFDTPFLYKPYQLYNKLLK